MPVNQKCPEGAKRPEPPPTSPKRIEGLVRSEKIFVEADVEFIKNQDRDEGFLYGLALAIGLGWLLGLLD